MLSVYTYKHFLSVHKRVMCPLLLALFWCIGLLAGYAVATKTSYSVLMRMFSLDRVSFVGLVFTAIIPLVISTAAFRLSLPLLILPIAFMKAFLFSFCASALTLVYADAGWLARWLYIFSDSFIVIFLLWFWVRNITGINESLQKDFAITLFASSLLICIDYFIVSPFSVMLFNYS